MVRGEMSAIELSELHVVPNQTSINAEYYHGTILNDFLLPDIKNHLIQSRKHSRIFFIQCLKAYLCMTMLVFKRVKPQSNGLKIIK